MVLSDLPRRSLRWGTLLGMMWASQGLLPAADHLAAIPARTESAPVADPLLNLVNEAIRVNRLRYLDVDLHRPWQIMHGILAYRTEYELKSKGQKISAIEYISNEAKFRGEYWFEKTPYGGRGHPFTEPYAFEGHVNQFLAILTMSNLPLEHEFRVQDGQVVTMAEMVRHAQLFTSTSGETTWTLWFLSRYLEPDAVWVNQAGEPWSMERLVDVQSQSPVNSAPCGGTHQLFALSLARNNYIQKHGRATGAWLRADQKIQQYIAQAQALQNRDGSFSAQFFRGAEFSNDFETRLKTTGHMLEWLMVALPEPRLREYWVRRAIETLSRDLITNSHLSAEPGALYHAVHSLVLYRERVTPASPPPPPALAAKTVEPPAPAPEPEPQPQPQPVIELQSARNPTAELPPPPPASQRNAERESPGLIDEAHPDGVNAPSTPVSPPPPLPPRHPRPLIIPGR